MEFKNLFFIKTQRKPGQFKKHYFKFLCFKFCICRPLMSDVISELSYRVYRSANVNLISTVWHFLDTSKEDDLYCLRNADCCFIFNRKVLDFGYNNFKYFIMNTYSARVHLFELEKLDKTAVLYQEHMDRLKNNEFLWKYRNEGLIAHQFMSFDKEGFYVNYTTIEDNHNQDTYDIDGGKHFIQIQKAKRPFYEGVSVKEYLEDKDYETQKTVLIKLAEYIFQNYAVANDMIDGKLFDCNPMNFIYDTKQQFHFIDKDFISKAPLSKDHIIKGICAAEADLTNDLLTYFGLPSKNHKKNTQPDKLELLKRKYFISYNYEDSRYRHLKK